MLGLSKEKLENILNDPAAGVYLLDKPKSSHSFDLVSLLRKELGIKKIGFAGTLDPLASGLMIMASGKATRLLDYFHEFPKTYVAEILFGQTSDTYDLEGKIMINTEAKEFTLIQLKKVLASFLGVQQQTAPIYSAKKFKGKKLHELARQGLAVTAPSKEIEIYNLDIIKFDYPQLTLQVSCGAGTYIRSLAYDLGLKMGTGALLSNLRRIKIGRWSVADALNVNEISTSRLVEEKIPIKEFI